MSDEFPAEDLSDPIALFRVWLSEAEKTELNDPNAAALATATVGAAPSVRMVLLKQLDERGFGFFTNAESQKGTQLAENPQAAMCFHWKSLRRQVRVDGTVTELPGTEADAYFHSRSRRSQLGAAASQQSHALQSRQLLEERVRELEALYPGEIPRPDFWRGYVLSPSRIEFWQEGPDRLHDRMLFLRDSAGWTAERLFP
ncbi:pyridoxamine 5'-phosphate oxidase [Granulicella sp. dw_53]|uniref:pyridoxamine 5'-phosphate oxidase n=1 Tax=Granulicella sp. dw_53 TaxID=2719792 RepID=UPI001BD480B3|nr:pyridoxamine 5'-phosphate oxidase [Granulicella sp. dw_53]